MQWLNTVLITTSHTSITLGTILFSVLFPTVGVILAGIIILRVLRKILESFHVQQATIQNTVRRVRYIISLSVVIAIITFIFRAGADFIPLEKIWSVFLTPFYQSGNTSISLVTVVLLVLLLYGAGIASSKLRIFLTVLLTRSLKDRKQEVHTITLLLRYVILALIFFIGLPLIGIDISSITVLFGVVGFGLGFGMQDLVANFFAGITISFSRVVSEGDRISVDNFLGDVIKINLLNTIVMTVTNETLIVPNKIITAKTIHNYSHSDPYIVIDGTVQVSYTSDLHVVTKVLQQAGEENTHRKAHSDIYVRVNSFDSSGISTSVWIWITNLKDKFAARSELNLRIWELFKEHNIEIPFPQMDLHIRSSAVPPPFHGGSSHIPST